MEIMHWIILEVLVLEKFSDWGKWEENIVFLHMSHSYQSYLPIYRDHHAEYLLSTIRIVSENQIPFSWWHKSE